MIIRILILAILLIPRTQPCEPGRIETIVEGVERVCTPDGVWAPTDDSWDYGTTLPVRGGL